jgi:hypothetical protein
MIKKHYLLLFYLTLLFASCKDSKKFDIQADWQGLDSDGKYFEYFFENNVVESFDETFMLNPKGSYKLLGDSIKLGQTIRSFQILNDSNIIIAGEDYSIELKRLQKEKNGFYLSDLISSKIFDGKSKDVWSDPILINYFDSNFRIRETKKRIELGQLNKDSLLTCWQRQSQLDSLNNSYFDFLIDKKKKLSTTSCIKHCE